MGLIDPIWLWIANPVRSHSGRRIRGKVSSEPTMPPSKPGKFKRRQFIGAAGSLGAVGVCSAAALEFSLVVDSADPVAGTPPARWAIGLLEDSLAARGVSVRKYERVAAAPGGKLCIVAAGAATASAPESFAIMPARVDGKTVLRISGNDVRGLVYAALELADQVQHASDPLQPLTPRATLAEQPKNKVP